MDCNFHNFDSPMCFSNQFESDFDTYNNDALFERDFVTISEAPNSASHGNVSTDPHVPDSQLMSAHEPQLDLNDSAHMEYKSNEADGTTPQGDSIDPYAHTPSSVFNSSPSPSAGRQSAFDFMRSLSRTTPTPTTPGLDGTPTFTTTLESDGLSSSDLASSASPVMFAHSVGTHHCYISSRPEVREPTALKPLTKAQEKQADDARQASHIDNTLNEQLRQLQLSRGYDDVVG